MVNRIHGVLGGPRQKISPPRTKIDRTNYLDIPEKLQEAEAIIVSSKENKLEFSKIEEEKPKPAAKAIKVVKKPKKKQPAKKKPEPKVIEEVKEELEVIEDLQVSNDQEIEEEIEENEDYQEESLTDELEDNEEDSSTDVETKDKIDEWLLKLSRQGD
jgi:hypothetical protein